MREINYHKTGTATDVVKIEAGDDADKYGVNHRYDFWLHKHNEWAKSGSVQFQKGSAVKHPWMDAKGEIPGPNGVTCEVLLAVLIDHLRSFQGEIPGSKGDFKCRANALAITHLEEALHWLKHRTYDRIERQVEGSYQV